MYEQFYGLRELPFSVMPNPRFAFRSLGHKMAEGRMRFAADHHSGLAVLTGPVGSGKTTVANMLINDWEDDPSKIVAYLPTAEERGRAAFLRMILNGFGVDTTARNYSVIRGHMETFLLDQYKAGKHAVLVLDEAQRIHSDNFDTLTDLTNFQTATEKFLTIILFAQDNLVNKLRLKDAFCSRIAFTGHLDPLSYDDTVGMIAHRLTTAGATVPEREVKQGRRKELLPDLRPYLTDEAMIEIYKITKGVPRDVCVFLSALFLDGYLRNERPLDIALVRSSFEEMRKMKKWPVSDKVVPQPMPTEKIEKIEKTEKAVAK